jgi:UDP-3-O-[3-hydroxymyristoyl] glucosamine N-acyltransferase
MGSLRLSELCETLGKAGLSARLDGEDREVTAVNTLESARDGEIAFLSNPKYLAAVSATRATAVLVRDGIEIPSHVSAVRTSDPYAAVTAAIIRLHGHRKHPQWGIHQSAVIDASARIGSNVNIGPGATIAANASIGANCTIYPGCYVGEGVTIGDDCTLFPNVVVYDSCALGSRVTIHAGSVIGEDGLGYASVNQKWIKIPQVGRAVIGDDVEIGANCAVDRATLGQTEIGPGTKFGNTVVIGHGTKIGPDCLFVGHVGLAGSVTVGRHVTLAGQVGVAGHLSIGDNVRVGAQAGVSGDIEPDVEVLGSPAIPADQAKRSVLAVQKLPEWIKRIKALEREVKELREQLKEGASR